jgi:hypothetical protein
MFESVNFTDNINLVPSEWIYENYLGLEEPLSGERVRMQSVFNKFDKTPSMFLYYNANAKMYKFKCFSTGTSGGPLNLMMAMWGVGYREACARIYKDYLKFLETGETVPERHIEYYEWKITAYDVRGWNNLDAQYWLQYGIGSSLLKNYNVYPLSSYTVSKYNSKGDVVNEFTVAKQYVYGYFTAEGDLYKIYQPKEKERKFIKLLDYIQGTDQLEGHPTLLIASSLKDAMTIKGLGLQVDIIAPHSENTMLHEGFMKEYLEKYQSVIVYFDSDSAGIKAMKEYNERYNIPFVYLSLEKDISEVYKVHGEKKALYEFYPKLQRAVEKTLGIF